MTELLIPEKLYGRDQAIQTLLHAANQVIADGVPELVLVSGYSGIGKSSVVQELHKALVAPRGLFAAGKFDQYKRDIPYATLAQAALAGSRARRLHRVAGAQWPRGAAACPEPYRIDRSDDHGYCDAADERP